MTEREPVVGIVASGNEYYHQLLPDGDTLVGVSVSATEADIVALPPRPEHTLYYTNATHDGTGKCQEKFYWDVFRDKFLSYRLHQLDFWATSATTGYLEMSPGGTPGSATFGYFLGDFRFVCVGLTGYYDSGGAAPQTNSQVKLYLGTDQVTVDNIGTGVNDWTGTRISKFAKDLEGDASQTGAEVGKPWTAQVETADSPGLCRFTYYLRRTPDDTLV